MRSPDTSILPMLASAGGTPAAGARFRLLPRAVGAIRRWLQRERETRELLALSQRELRDIGTNSYELGMEIGRRWR